MWLRQNEVFMIPRGNPPQEGETQPAASGQQSHLLARYYCTIALVIPPAVFGIAVQSTHQSLLSLIDDGG